MRETFWIFCGGDYGDVVTVLETSVTVRDIDRRVLLVHVAVEVGLITCVWGRIGQAARHSTPVNEATGFTLRLPNEVEDAEVLDRGQGV